MYLCVKHMQILASRPVNIIALGHILVRLAQEGSAYPGTLLIDGVQHHLKSWHAFPVRLIANTRQDGIICCKYSNKLQETNKCSQIFYFHKPCELFFVLILACKETLIASVKQK